MNERDTITREERMADLAEAPTFDDVETLPIFLDELIDPETCRKIINGELP